MAPPDYVTFEVNLIGDSDWTEIGTADITQTSLVVRSPGTTVNSEFCLRSRCVSNSRGAGGYVNATDTFTAYSEGRREDVPVFTGVIKSLYPLLLQLLYQDCCHFLPVLFLPLKFKFHGLYQLNRNVLILLLLQSCASLLHKLLKLATRVLCLQLLPWQPSLALIQTPPTTVVWPVSWGRASGVNLLIKWPRMPHSSQLPILNVSYIQNLTINDCWKSYLTICMHHSLQLVYFSWFWQEFPTVRSG